MIRALVAGGLAFAAVYAAEKQLSAVRKDWQHYDDLRAMSGEQPLLRELLGKAGEAFSGLTSAGQGEARTFFASLQADVMRYARLRGM